MFLDLLSTLRGRWFDLALGAPWSVLLLLWMKCMISLQDDFYITSRQGGYESAKQMSSKL
jgi:hypothetical protein